MKRLGKRTLEFRLPPTILSHGAVGGKKEAEGPLGGDFDQTFQDTTLQKESWEKAEAQLQKEAVAQALSKAGTRPEEVDFILAGDLLNQCISSTFGLLDFRIPFLGQYGACSTMAQTLLLASILVESGAARRALAVTSSHFCSAERQFRLPLEYGGQRAPTAQWTATAAGCALVGLGGPVVIRRGLAGTIQDLGVKDAANMGAAMAPAAAESIFSSWRTPAPALRTTTASTRGTWGRWAQSCCTSVWGTMASTCVRSTRTAACCSTTGSARMSTRGPRAAGARPRCFAATCCAAWSGESCGASCSAPRGR